VLDPSLGVRVYHRCVTNPNANGVVSALRNGGKARSHWRNRDFLVLAAASVVMSLGYQIYSLDFPLLINQISARSPVAMGALKGIEFLPNMLLASFIGVIVDRVSKRRFISAVTAVRAIVLLGIFGLLAAGTRSILAILAAGFLVSAVVYAYHNARMSIIKLVFHRSELMAVNGSYSLLQQVVAIAGPAAAGLVLTVMPLNDGVLVIAATAVAGFLLLRALHFSDPPPERKGTFLADLREGWVELRGNRLLLALSIVVIFLNSTEGSFEAMFIYFAKDRLGVGPAELGLFMMLLSVGAAVGATVAARLRTVLGLGQLFMLSIVGTGVGFLVMGIGRGLAPTIFSLLLVGCASMVLSVGIWSFRQESTPPELIGRVSGLTGSIFKLGMPFAIFASGLAASAVGARGIFMVCALVNALVVLYFFASPLRTAGKPAMRSSVSA
jgi:MFS family permease